MASTPDDMLSIKDIIRETAWDRSSISRCLSQPEVRDLLGGQQHPRYPRSSLPAFQALRTAAREGKVTPRTAPIFLRRFLEIGGDDTARAAGGDTALVSAIERLTIAVDRLREEIEASRKSN